MFRKIGTATRGTITLGTLLLAGCGSSPTPTNNTNPQTNAGVPVAPVAPVAPVTAPRRPGDGYGGDPITEPIRQMFRAELQIQQSMAKKEINAYKVLHDGKAPKSHEQFMKEIVGQTLYLPKAPEGFEWRYDPKEESIDIQPIKKAP